MMSLAGLYKGQNKYGVSREISTSELVSYEMYLGECRRIISDRTPAEYHNWVVDVQNAYTQNLLLMYVKTNPKQVDGFLDTNGDLITDELVAKLMSDIVDFGILCEALEDDTVQEIQINDYKTIWVVRGGKSELYVDRTGQPYQFLNDEELGTVINRLVVSTKNDNTPRLTQANPLLNARTSRNGYRLSAVNSTATTPDSKPGMDFPVTSVTIRKYAPSMLTFTDFEDYNTLTPEMSKFLRLCGKADTRLICVGPTSSGKTTLLNAIVWEIPRDERLLLIQNPTEIMVYERSDETGANIRNALHWEAADLGSKGAEDATTGTMSNMIAHTLRNTPDVIIPGEVRTPEEFFQMNRALKTGHRVLSTLHASDGGDAISRISTELATLGGSIADYASSMASSLDIAVSQKKLADGSRRVVAIEEYTGVIKPDGTAETRVIFRYNLTGKVDKDADGKILKIHGYFEQVNPISDSLVQKFYVAGISREELLDYIGEVTRVEGESNLESQKEQEKVREEEPKEQETRYEESNTTEEEEDEVSNLSFL